MTDFTQAISPLHLGAYLDDRLPRELRRMVERTLLEDAAAREMFDRIIEARAGKLPARESESERRALGRIADRARRTARRYATAAVHAPTRAEAEVYRFRSVETRAVAQALRDHLADVGGNPTPFRDLPRVIPQAEETDADAEPDYGARAGDAERDLAEALAAGLFESFLPSTKLVLADQHSRLKTGRERVVPLPLRKAA